MKRLDIIPWGLNAIVAPFSMDGLVKSTFNSGFRKKKKEKKIKYISRSHYMQDRCDYSGHAL